jgi:hypothetical protein
MQLENCINCVCQNLNAHEVIQKTPSKYKDDFTNLLVGDFSFFDKGNKKPLTKIQLPSKIFFVKNYYNIKYSYDDIREMILIRNKSSHRGDYTTQERETLNKVQNSLMERKASYFKTFDTFFKKMEILFQDEIH